MAPEETKPSGPSGEKPPTGQPRIHVDTDWKRQAQAEKERLAHEVEERAAAAPPGAAGPGAAAPGMDAAEREVQEIPPATFTTLIQTIATQAAIFMSDQRDPETGESFRQLDLAKHNIDLLAVLEEKTQGHLTDEEKQLLDTLLYELRMAYISAAS